MSDTVLVERAEGIATVTLNRPASLNALTRDMWGAVRDVFRALDADEALRCIVLRGAGARAFCPGADISEFSEARATVGQARAYGDLIRDTLEAIGDCRHPVVAMIHGPCTGGGLELATLCDLRIAGESGRFGIPINRLGIVLGYPEYRAFLDLVGKSAALELLLEGKMIGAAEALAKGLVNRVVPDARLADEVYATARRIADGAPLVNRWHKKFARRLADPRPLTEAEYAEAFASVETDDYREGTRAFLEKRKPAFKGR
ncbi:MAG: enoyl-CoA hydratase/isomerase family protein [Alphaproteobacteria bacterium]